MKIIFVHNRYRLAGGEDSVVDAEKILLTQHGHEVICYLKDNKDIPEGMQLISSVVNTVWNQRVYKEFRKLLETEKPDVVHCHNTFPIISPSVYWACAKEKVPVVQTLHNYRLLCLNALLFRPENRKKKRGNRTHKAALEIPSFTICEQCLGKGFKWDGILYGCYRGSRAGSLIVAIMLWLHKVLGTWCRVVNAYIVLTEFQKKKVLEEGLPEGRVFVKPNFIDDPPESKVLLNDYIGTQFPEDVFSFLKAGAPYVLYVGRLSHEKGINVLLDAWMHFYSGEYNAEGMSGKTPYLVIVGDGPQRDMIRKDVMERGIPQVCFMGHRDRKAVLGLMKKACVLVFPSAWYETFGLTVLEAGLMGTPSVVDKNTTTASLVTDKSSGMLFDGAEDLTEKIRWSLENTEEINSYGLNAQKEFSEKYSAEMSYRQLIRIYKSVKSVED